MEHVVINKYVVPESVRQSFLDELSNRCDFFASQKGFLRGTVFDKAHGPGVFNIVNVAHWKSLDAVLAARERLRTQYADRGATPDAVYQQLGIRTDVAIYVAKEDY